jgi:glycine betaine transporter
VTSAPFLVIIAGLAVAFWKELTGDRRAAAAAFTAATVTVPAPRPVAPAETATAQSRDGAAGRRELTD